MRRKICRKSQFVEMWRAALLAVTIGAWLGLSGCGNKKSNPGTELGNDSSGITLTDAVGTRGTFTQPAKRVISLAPNLTEIVFAIGAGDRLVGRTSWCNYPPQAQRVPVVGDFQSTNYEMMVRLAPDLVLMTFAGNSDVTYQRLQELGLHPWAIEGTSIESVLGAIDTIGTLLGMHEQALRVADSLRKRIDRVRKRAGLIDPVDVFVVISANPLMTVASGFIDELLQAAGGHNIAAGGTIPYPTYSREELLRRDPDVIIVPATGEHDIEQLFELYPEWRSLRAVRTGRIITIEPDLLMRPGPRMVDGLEELFRILHPDNQRRSRAAS